MIISMLRHVRRKLHYGILFDRRLRAKGSLVRIFQRSWLLRASMSFSAKANVRQHSGDFPNRSPLMTLQGEEKKRFKIDDEACCVPTRLGPISVLFSIKISTSFKRCLMTWSLKNADVS